MKAAAVKWLKQAKHDLDMADERSGRSYLRCISVYCDIPTTSFGYMPGLVKWRSYEEENRGELQSVQSKPAISRPYCVS